MDKSIAPPTKRVTEKSLLDLWKDKHETEKVAQDQRAELDKQQKKMERELREKELAISERKISLDEKKFDHEVQKYEDNLRLQRERLDLEKQERQSILNTQHALLTLVASIKK